MFLFILTSFFINSMIKDWQSIALVLRKEIYYDNCEKNINKETLKTKYIVKCFTSRGTYYNLTYKLYMFQRHLERSSQYKLM